jgi:CubicO group peptidase (beta-lactamase class C family)
MRSLLALALIGCAGAPRPSSKIDPPAPDSPTANGTFGGVTHAPPPAQPPPYPIPDWPTATPADVGLDAAKLDQAAQVADGDGSYCLLVIRHGLLAYERYFAGSDATTTHKSWSLAKSYSGTLVGIAVDRGELSLDTPAANWIADWQSDSRATITVRDLVRMTSGLTWSAFQDYVEMAELAPDDTQFALGLALSDPPGSKWIYHNGAVQILEPLFRAATGMTIEAYAQARLWSKLGMQASWAHDMAGHPTPYANVLATCRDHARLGYLYLRGGQWGAERVLSQAWVQEALTPSQPFNRAYGLLFWLNGGTPAIDAMMNPWPGQMVSFAPPDLFAARGFGNQFIDVIPSLDLLVVRFGDDPLAGNIADIVSDAQFTKHDEILRPVLDAVQN